MLSIVTLPDKSLRERSKEIDRDLLLSPKIQSLIDEMMPVMYAADGIGLAGVQVGHGLRICTIGKSAVPPKHSLKREDFVLINPVWINTSKRKKDDSEGCLSVPKTYGKVKRYKYIKVTALDRHGNPLSFDAKDLLARVVQHEVDHMDGILFIDKATGIYQVE